MGCIKLSILDEQYKKTEIKVSSRRENLTSNFCAGSLRSYTLFGQVISKYNQDWELDTIIPQYLFTGMERDEESGMDYMNARYYSSDWGGFICRDRLFEDYFWCSGYSYCLNNPVKYVDPSGDSVAVLLAGNVLAGIGHMGVLIQNDKGQWGLWSQNGENLVLSGRNVGTPNYMGEETFNSIQDFLDHPKANSSDGKGTDFPYYTDAYMIPTTPAQDRKVEEGMKEKLAEQYTFTTNNCGQAVKYALEKGGVSTAPPPKKVTWVDLFIGNPQQEAIMNMSYNTVPPAIFQNIKAANKNGKSYKPKQPKQ